MVFHSKRMHEKRLLSKVLNYDAGLRVGQDWDELVQFVLFLKGHLVMADFMCHEMSEWHEI